MAARAFSLLLIVVLVITAVCVISIGSSLDVWWMYAFAPLCVGFAVAEVFWLVRDLRRGGPPTTPPTKAP